MNNKEIVAQAIHQVVKEDLSIEQVQQLLENPKSADHGDVAFPAFSSKSLSESAAANCRRLSRKNRSSVF